MAGMASNNDNSPAMQAIIKAEIDGWAENLSFYHHSMDEQRAKLVREESRYSGRSHFERVAYALATMDRIAEKINEIRARMDGLQACII